ncbi:hypothetical protein J5H37_13930 [Stenotrophomonas maltophilia]|uniref:hypothetical protein n=1 Tax=Stenotrophomonas maltophilia TaxID=40324 RepID=UPI0019D4E7AA|nr:hypothetical protein [Stenotrophomonas maltophilia]MBN7829982.1 hypothetical protein [Stenotrophomonas maltophilia]MBN7835134.1 hypothetical protein [Stenotrophomonas maltophilia]MBN7859137.1 hypothetical protein [Stenotrophomonas maltophilia]MBN7919469.1 hypothetical protein [Stenotrophomonas maltophilia]MBO2844793.1 hypothetical protein [Stenotrophomonas maltophilia]
MKQISRRTNPTGLNEIDRRHFSLRISDDGKSDRTFWLERFDFTAAGIAPEVLINCIATSGSSEQYFALGTVSNFSRTARPINELVRNKPVRFRFVFHMPGEKRLIGFADGVRPIDESGNLGGSLVDIFPTDLNGPVWELDLPPTSADASAKPCILVERSIFPVALAAVNHHWFVSLVMPEVMRKVAMRIGEHSGSLDDDDTWTGTWKAYIDQLDVGPPPEDEDDLVEEWAASVVRRFASTGHLRLQIDRLISEMHGDMTE